MKKRYAVIISVICVLILAGSVFAYIKDTEETVPTIRMGGRYYVASYMPLDELPGNYFYAGKLDAGEAHDTGLEGCSYYFNIYDELVPDFYVYQECGTPIDENTVDSTQIQWAYVHWVISR